MSRRDNFKKIVFIIVTIFFANFLILNNVNAQSQDAEVIICVSKEVYDDWEKLSDEEKANRPIPNLCEETEKKSFVNLTIDTLSYINATADLPTSYDPRVEGITATIKNQMDTGTCWTHATTTSLELYSKKILDLDYSFSPRHIEYSSTRKFLNDEVNPNGYNRNLGSGGNFLMSSNYLMNDYGPISEEEMPFENNEDLIYIEEIQNKKQLLDVNNIILYNATAGSACTASEISDIKNYILKKGTVSVGIYMSVTENYYNEETAGYAYIGSNAMNHIANIVGWDDEYSTDNFNSQNKPLSKGAWIVQNSWGEEWGDDGYFYISYTDSNVCKNYMVIDNADTTLEDNLYVHDNLGMNASASVSTGKTGYAMNVFTKEEGSEEILKEVTFGSQGKGTYKIYYMEGNGSKTKVANMQEIGSGSLDYKGYITHKLEEEIILGENVTDFSVVIYYQMASLKSMIPISVSNEDKYQYLTAEANRSFVSSTGSTWSDILTKVEEGTTAVISIKVATDDYMNSSIYEIDKENLVIYVPDETELDEFKTNIKATTKEVYQEDEIVSEGTVGTGMKYNNYSIIVKGDVTGDGKIRMNDVMMISRYIVEETGIDEDIYLSAADVSKDSDIRMNDVMMLSRYIVEGEGL